MKILGAIGNFCTKCIVLLLSLLIIFLFCIQLEYKVFLVISKCVKCKYCKYRRCRVKTWYLKKVEILLEIYFY